MGRILCGYRLRVSRIPQQDRCRPPLSRGWCPEGPRPSAAGSGDETEAGAGAGVGAEDRPVVLKQFEPSAWQAAGAGGVGGDEPEAWAGTAIGFWGGAAAESEAWPEAVAVAVSAVAGGEGGAGAVGRLRRSY